MEFSIWCGNDYSGSSPMEKLEARGRFDIPKLLERCGSFGLKRSGGQYIDIRRKQESMREHHIAASTCRILSLFEI